MDFVRILSAASVFLAALWLIAPKGKTEKTFKYAMEIFLISVIISTFNSSFKLPENLPNITTATPSDTAQRLSSDTAKYVIEELLKKCNIKFGEIQIITDNSKNSGISITKAYIELSPDDFGRAAEIIKNQTGIILVDGV